MTRSALAIYRDDLREITLDELANAAGVHPSLVERFVECGLLEPTRSRFFDASAVPRLGAICRIRRDFGANLSSAAVILDLVERIGELERELGRLRALR